MTKNETWAKIADIILSVKENFILLYGGRGIGKTYTVIDTIIEDCICNSYEFSLIVPTENELNHGALRNWVDKVIKEKHTEIEFKFTNGAMYYRTSEDADLMRIGACLSLSQAEREKKRGDLARIKYMIMDEAMVQSPTLISGFVYNFNVLYETIDRERNTTRAIFMGNTINKINPLFDFFGVKVEDLKHPGTVTKTLNRYAWYIPKPDDMNEKNIFRQMVSGTTYGNMADGYFKTNYGQFIKYPDVDVFTFDSLKISWGDTHGLLTLCSDGIVYFQSTSKEFAERFTNIHRRYQAKAADATQVEPMIPAHLREFLRRKLEHGMLRFIDEESFLVLAPKIQSLTGVIII